MSTTDQVKQTLKDAVQLTAEILNTAFQAVIHITGALTFQLAHVVALVACQVVLADALTDFCELVGRTLPVFKGIILSVVTEVVGRTGM